MVNRFRSAVCAIVVSLALASSAAAAPSTQKYVYSVTHSRYGRIGTFTNSVTRDGNDTTVSTEIHIAVSLIGITLFRQDASRQEHWKAGRLISFHGVTTTNGNSTELNGAARGDEFVMHTPFGDTIAPAAVRLANPWSRDAVSGDFMLTPDRGRLDRVSVRPEDRIVLAAGPRQTQAQKYDVYLPDGSRKYEVDIDDQGTVVRFVLFNRDGSVTFSLER